MAKLSGVGIAKGFAAIPWSANLRPMSLLALSRTVRVAVLVGYGLVVGVGQGLHYFAPTDVCHGVHQHAEQGCCGGCCGEDSPFARHRLTADTGRSVFSAVQSSNATPHQCQDCAICQSLAQLVGDAPSQAVVPTLPWLPGDGPVGSERSACVADSGRPEARGPPSGVMFV